jgi:hypothetical protein
MPRSLVFHCISSPVYEVKILSQALCWPLGLIGCSPSRFQDLHALETCSPRSCIFYKLRQDSHTQCVHCPLYHIYTAGILTILCVQVCTSEPSGLCSLVRAQSLNLLIARSSLALLVRVSHQHFGLLATSTGSPPGLMFQFQLLLVMCIRCKVLI